MRWPGDCVDSFGKFVGFCRIVTRQARVSASKRADPHSIRTVSLARFSKPAYTRRVCPPDDAHLRLRTHSMSRAARPAIIGELLWKLHARLNKRKTPGNHKLRDST